MLELKNIMEDMVVSIIGELEDSANDNLTQTQRLELASYVLNRIQPMYITSNKGFTHIIQKYKNDPQFLADIMVKVDEGIKIIRKTLVSKKQIPELDTGAKYYFLPRLYGKIISSRTLRHIESGTVTLSIDGHPAEPAFSAWPNPVNLSPDDNGIYTFAPMPVKAGEKAECKTFQIKITVNIGDDFYEKFVTYLTCPISKKDVELELNENILQIEDIYVPF